MTPQQIIDNAIYIQFPIDKSRYREYSEVKNKIHKLPLPNNMMYTNWYMNHNHFTTEYHRIYVLPLLNELFNFNYNENDFYLCEKNYLGNDISILYPKMNYLFNIISFEHNETFENITYADIVEGCTINHPSITPYHKLYKYPHECSIIINNTITNNRKLFISGDSQMIPDVGILACYFKEVWYMDNRTNNLFKHYFEHEEFSDILIEVNNEKIQKYYENNLK